MKNSEIITKAWQEHLSAEGEDAIATPGQSAFSCVAISLASVQAGGNFDCSARSIAFRQLDGLILTAFTEFRDNRKRQEARALWLMFLALYVKDLEDEDDDRLLNALGVK